MLRIFGLSKQAPTSAPEQTSALMSTDRDRDPVPEVVTKPAKTSSKMTASVRPVVPRLFVQSDYVAAVRASDGAILSGGVAANPGDVIELYGIGFGTSALIEGEAGSAAKCSTENPVAVSIGGITADVRFAGQVGPALYQINVTVPVGLSGGDHPVIASTAGMSTQSGALLKIAKASDASTSPEATTLA